MQAPRRRRGSKIGEPGRKPAAKVGSAHARVPLSRERIAAAAMALIDRDGLEALSFRKLGEALGYEAMSLYHHFPSKAHLIDALVDGCVASARFAASDRPWVEQLRAAARDVRRVALQHPKFAPLLVVHRLNTPTGVAYLDRIIGIFRAAGFDNESAATLFRDMSYFLMGAILDESSGYAKGPSAAEPVSDVAIARDCPNLNAVAPFFKPAYFDATFEAGLDILIEGIKRAHKAKR